MDLNHGHLWTSFSRGFHFDALNVIEIHAPTKRMAHIGSQSVYQSDVYGLIVLMRMCTMNSYLLNQTLCFDQLILKAVFPRFYSSTSVGIIS